LADDIDEKLRADTYYLSGLIAIDQGDTARGLVDLDEADSMYASLKRPANRYHVALNRAKAYTLRGRYESAIADLESARELFDRAPELPHLGTWHERMRDVLVSMGDYPEALHHGQALEGIYEGPRLGSCYSELGFIYAAMGDADLSTYYTTKAFPLVQGDERRIIYNRVNNVLLFRLLKLPYGDEEAAIKAWNAEKKEARLEQHLELALTLNPKYSKKVEVTEYGNYQ
jgi:tetratricopeptide (TPR) repeat protein